VAQISGGSDFDWVWEEWENALLRLVREAANTCARSGVTSIDPERLTSVLFCVLARPRPSSLWYGPPTWPVRFLDGVSETPPVSESLGALGVPLGEESAVVVTEVARIFRKATTSWSDGDPEEPTTRDCLREVLEYLWARRIVPRPPSRAFPRGV
jgi:hypothetical protein